MVTVAGNRITVSTRTLEAVLEAGVLISLRDAAGQEMLQPGTAPASAVQLVYGQAAVEVAGLASACTAHRLSDHSAQFRLSGWDADAVITIGEDPESGDLLVEPSAYSSRPGVLACRWLLPAVDDELELVAPFFQGVRLPLADPLLQRRWTWPHFWEAGLAILQGPRGGFWLHCQDDRYRYKALHIAEGRLGLETEAYGPVHDNLAAGGLTWRLNVHQGDWQVPAGRYRAWLWRAYGLEAAEARRKPWIHDIRFALSWYHGDLDLLDALAEKLDPRTVLLHFSDWRTDRYDENYPDYCPSDKARAVFAKARALGMHVMPHGNSVDMDPSHPAYAYLRDFEYREVGSGRLQGWGYDPEAGGILGVPNSNHQLADNRRRKVMVKIHPGLSMWRSILCERLGEAVRDLETDTVFIDVTLCSWNIRQCLVENQTPTEGMNRLIHQVADLEGGLAVGGEGLNEITMQGLSFAQAHLFNSWHASHEGLVRTGGCALNDFLFGRLCRTFGYSRLSGKDEAEELRMRIHEEHGAIPTVTVGTAAEIRQPNAAVARLLKQAAS
ncbi:MAG: hypothetical protein HUU35_12580 [Armatimonadetes bacterium]|nr:hypothetical protein [Armatimonadota bacterium]